jgi:hypothetical protein
MRLLLAGGLLFVAACAREPVVAPDHPPAPVDDAGAASPSASSSASGTPAESAPRPLTSAELADNCGYKGDLVCCLGPKMAGPQPKPFCYPAR